jgi:hypothetical protein
MIEHKPGKQYFTVTEEHIALLRRANVGWEDCEFGAPSIDCKRPYGNSSVYSDIAEILGIKASEDGDFAEGERERMRKLHEETQQALRIFLATGQMMAGEYEADRYRNDWTEAKPKRS